MNFAKGKGKGKQVDLDPDDADEIMRQIFAGHERLISRGTGQEASACGLAALNCARIILTAEQEGLKGEDLIKFILDPSTAKQITSIGDKWSSPKPLEVEDIFRVPLFSKSLILASSRHGVPSFAEFRALLLQLMVQSPNTSACVVVIRPSGLITCVKIATDIRDVFLIFDSHSRPSHPGRAGFTFTTSIDNAARILALKSSVDERLLADTGSWKTQLLTTYSGHIFLSNSCGYNGVERLTETVLESSLAILELQAEVDDLKNEISSLRAKQKKLEPESQRRIFASSSQEANKSRHPTRRSPNIVARTLPIDDEPDMFPLPTEALVYYSGDPCYPKDSNIFESHLSVNSEDFPSFDLTPENHDLTLHNSIEIARERQREYEEDMRLEVQRPTLSDESIRDNHHPVVHDLIEVPVTERQREYEKEDRRLRAERMVLSDASQKVFCCTVCLDDHPEDDLVFIDGCQHKFCRDCLKGYIISKLHDHRYPIYCPNCISTGAENNVITERVIAELGISEKDCKLFEELQLSEFSVLLHCRKCKSSVFVDRSEYQESNIIPCPLPGCNFIWCKMCEQTIVAGSLQHSCDGSLEMERIVKAERLRRCPGCTTPIQKTIGCNHMTCISPGCNSHFCYRCGDLIVKSALRHEIQNALSVHYRRCTLFDPRHVEDYL